MTEKEAAAILETVLREHPQTRGWSPEVLLDEGHVVAVETGEGDEFFIEVHRA